MKGIAARLVIVIAFVGGSFVCARAGTSRTFSDTDVVGKASGVGSIPAVVLCDGTVCALVPKDPSRCWVLGTLPAEASKVIGSDDAYFDGVFDMLGDKVPQVFVDYWPEYRDPNCLPPYNTSPIRPGENADCDAVALLVYRYSRGRYRRYLTLNAPTMGYKPGAWFLDESPRKAIFETRYSGSSGAGLFYLDPKKQSLELVSDHYDIEGEPIFEDIDHDANAEVFIPARGRDRTATQGAALLKWTGSTYRVWWPDWNLPPYVVNAQMAQVEGDRTKEIVAILDPASDWMKGSSSRTLGIWKLTAGTWRLNAKTALPSTDAVASPQIAAVIPESMARRFY